MEETFTLMEWDKESLLRKIGTFAAFGYECTGPIERGLKFNEQTRSYNSFYFVTLRFI